jgi:hypothetical protein
MTLKYTTVSEFLRRYGLLASTKDFLVGQTPTRETVTSGTVVAGTYYLDHLGVVTDSLVLYVGTSATALTLTTHYTFDASKSEVTITSAGATALGTSDLTAHYDYCTLESRFNNADATSILEASESEFEEDAEMFFSTVASPQYRHIENEIYEFAAQNLRYKDYVNFRYNPSVNLETTTNGAYTTGGSTITLTDGTGFPTGTCVIYIGGYKVEYSSRSGNSLTVPTTTPSISSGSTVRGEVIEISLESEGNTPSWSVLTYGEQYEVYPNTGHVKILSSAFYNEMTSGVNKLFRTNPRFRSSYLQAWHEPSEDVEIPSQVVDTMYAIAARMMSKRTARRGQITNIEFDLNGINLDETRIEKVKDAYSNQHITIK